jgi:CRP-like cAMP-binding protein
MQVSDSLKDISVEEANSGETLGWSALVKPYRFTRSARAAEPSEVIAFTRRELLEFFETQPRIGYLVLTRISELVGLRLLKMRALWARALQRVVAQEAARVTK